jgi:hypothetical protein
MKNERNGVAAAAESGSQNQPIRRKIAMKRKS